MAKSFRDTWTVTRGPDGDRGGPELVVLVPPTQSNAAGFSRCRSLIERGDDARPVRLIAEGATIERYWPSWVARAPRCFRMTELDAYLPRDKGPPIVEVTSQLETWLDRVLDGVAPGVRSSAVFWSSALDRHLDQTCQAWLLACGLDDAHRGDELTCTQPSWDCFRFLQARRGMAVTPVEQPRARLAATVLAMQAATLGKRALEYVRERPARRELLRRRAQHAGSPTPRVWITVLGDWPRASRPVLDKIAPLVRESGERLGVLLQTWLHPGLRNSHNQPADPKQMLPTLDAPELDGIIGAIDQGVTAESAAALARAMIESTALSLRVLARVLRSPLTLKLGARTIPIRLADAQLAKLLTLDVLRAREAHHAAQAFARRRSFDGDGDGGGASGRAGEPVVILPHASAVNDRVLVQRFEQRGAATVELVHGVTELSYQLGSGRTHTRVKAMWSVPEARALGPLVPDQRCVGGYYPRPFPRPVRRPPLAAGEPIPILVASNYVVNTWGFDPRMFEHYLEPLLRAAVEAQRALDVPIALRWRPHPDDDPKRVKALRADYPELEPSTGSLDEDFRWARVLVTSMSSITMEALWYELPIFVHQIPWWNDSMLAAFDPARLFGHERSLAELLAPCLERVARGDAAALLPETALRRALFGGSDQPRSAASLLDGEAPHARAEASRLAGA